MCATETTRIPQEARQASNAVAITGTTPNHQPQPAPDPYKYQTGFGNHHTSEAIPGALPVHGTNIPQRHKYGLYAEHLNGSSFISSRQSVSNVWMYRERPAAPHALVERTWRDEEAESCFLPTNENVTFAARSYTWAPLVERYPSCRQPITFPEGMKTIGGNGDATLREGVAIHQYLFDSDMTRQAYVNHDGEMLLIPQQGVLDIKTEMGTMRVPPTMIAVVPAGIRFSVSIVSDDQVREARGYVFEVFGTRFALPELGVLGANGLAHVRDFEYPVAAFDLEAPDRDNMWEIAVKMSGKRHSYYQAHTPFDVVAWHGKYAPYRYDLKRFGHLTANVDQLDPTAFCVLTAPSKWPGVSAVDFCIFGEKWVVTKDTLRIPYYHRTMATELCGIIRGEYAGSTRQLEAGGLSFEQSFMPHGETYEAHNRDMNASREPVKTSSDYLGFMFHVSSPVALTEFAMVHHPGLHDNSTELWESFHRSDLVDHMDEINKALTDAGMEPLSHPLDRLPKLSHEYVASVDENVKDCDEQ